MLPKTARLPRSAAGNVFKLGKKTRTTYFDITLQDSVTGNCRWLIIIPKKVLPLAYARNRIKRLISEALRTLTPRFHGAVDGIIVYKKRLPEPTLETVSRLLTAQLAVFL